MFFNCILKFLSEENEEGQLGDYLLGFYIYNYIVTIIFIIIIFLWSKWTLASILLFLNQFYYLASNRVYIDAIQKYFLSHWKFTATFVITLLKVKRI